MESLASSLIALVSSALTLKIAARAQHIERWTVPRSSYPEGRIAYLTWRKDLQKLHGAAVVNILLLFRNCKQ
jgi:hypothetical protein